jgi:ketosteroid isomerase-like protein
MTVRAHTGAMLIAVALYLLFQARVGETEAPAPAATLDDRFVLDLHEKKIDDVLTLYTKDAVFVNPDGTEATGPGLRKLYEQVTAAFDSDLHLKRVSLKRSINTMIEDGTYTEELGHRDTRKVDHVTGTYRFTMHLDADGQWRYIRMEWHLFHTASAGRITEIRNTWNEAQGYGRELGSTGKG